MHWHYRPVFTCAVLLAGLVGCSSSSDSGPTARSLVLADNAALTQTNIKPGTTYVFQAGNVCTEGGPVQITSVTPDATVGRMVLTDWGTRHQLKSEIGGDHDPNGQPVTLASLGGFSKAKFNQSCADKRAYREFNVELHATTAAAAVNGFTVHYGNGRSFRVPVGFGLCSATETKGGNCPTVEGHLS